MRVVHAVAAERRRVARELDDAVGHDLSFAARLPIAVAGGVA
ncbi:MAG: hypothetical protein JST08_08295 [Actinobacteria bacterium]|nr:hypothetical protein [Actinomycetota bacterium]